MTRSTEAIELADWRRQVAELYATIRHQNNPETAWHHFRAVRDRLFKYHPQSPLTTAQQVEFISLPYFAYNPAWRLAGTLHREVEPDTFTLQLPAEGEVRYTRIALIRFPAQGTTAALALFSLEGYGGGLFLPFRDATNGQTTYPGGRYLYDTIKGADLNTSADEFILDFNYAYNPSCAYNDRWVCPLPPAENSLALPVTAGEQAPGNRWGQR